MSYFVIARTDSEDKVEYTTDMDRAKQLASKWTRELNCESHVCMILGKFVPRQEWVGVALDSAPGSGEPR